MGKGNIMPKWDEAGNLITTKPKKPQDEDVDPEIMKEILAAGQAIKNSVDMVKEYESEPETKDEKEFPCQYNCGKVWKTDLSRLRHENWCPKNPEHRGYRLEGTEVKKKPKKPKTKTKADPKPRGRPKAVKENDIIKELKAFDKIFGITDEQIAKYIRGKMK